MPAAIVLALAACGVHDPVLDPTSNTTPIVVGSDNSVHGELMARIYAGALAHTGAPVHTDVRIGDRRDTLAALDAGTVTVVPEQTGDLLAYLDPAARQSEADDVFDALNRALPQGLAVADYGTAQWGSADDNAPAQNVLPLFRAGSLDETQTLKLNVVAGELTTTDLAQMAEQVDGGSSSADVAAAWLGGHGL